MNKILSILIYFLARTLHLTYRYRYAGNENIKAIKNNNQNFIFAIWHQNLLAGILAQTGLPHIVIISKSKDAEAVAFTCRHLGHFVVRGSSKRAGVDKGGAIAKDAMIDYLNSGHPGAVTVDGPKGPPLKVKPGIIGMAKQSQALLVPYTASSNSYWEFNSWDRFQLPKPFSKILITYGKPLCVPSSCEEFEVYQQNLETAMNEQTIYTLQSLKQWQNFDSKNWFQ